LAAEVMEQVKSFTATWRMLGDCGCGGLSLPLPLTLPKMPGGALWLIIGSPRSAAISDPAGSVEAARCGDVHGWSTSRLVLPSRLTT
jgi:hypothetical protein